ncbi:hypothetical protein AB0B89_09985 [Sphaerisporangium sp. NPDC049002]|uniref:hypothetical protein n=1 Tax=Sphaerisporangium sp. NPDC049002 TaxID=3155392 RepID=UPI0033FEBD58
MERTSGGWLARYGGADPAAGGAMNRAHCPAFGSGTCDMALNGRTGAGAWRESPRRHHSASRARNWRSVGAS